jgi:hypothetical protein
MACIRDQATQNEGNVGETDHHPVDPEAEPAASAERLAWSATKDHFASALRRLLFLLSSDGTIGESGGDDLGSTADCDETDIHSISA